MQTIYKITSPTGQIYIGKTTNLLYRLQVHKYRSKKQTTKLYASIRKYGWEEHRVDILFQAECSSLLLKTLECMYIKQYNSQDKGLNMTAGGDGGSTFAGRKHTPEALSKIRQAAIDRPKDSYPSKPIVQYTKDGQFLQQWPSACAVESALGISRASISNTLKGRSATAGGFSWSYVNFSK